MTHQGGEISFSRCQLLSRILVLGDLLCSIFI